MDAELTWANLMARTHEAPGGFSSTQPAQAHFTTSVDVGTHIAAVVLARCEAAAGRHGIERPWIVDVGAGSGRLLAQLIALGFPADRRDYGIGMQILVDIGVRQMRLITNNPAKRAGLEGYGLEVVERVPIITEPNPFNLHYLDTKRRRMGHLLDGLETLAGGD